MNSSKISFSVVICTLNNYKGLERCVASICDQSVKPLEIIVVHGETGGDIVERLKPVLNEKTIVLKYIRAIRSLVIQRNAGIDHATGEVVVFLDDDVILNPEYFELLMDVYREKWHYNLGGVQGVIIENSEINHWNPLQTISRIFLLSNVTGQGTLLASANPAFRGVSRTVEKVEIFSGCMMSFRRDVLHKHRFDENFREFWAYDDVELSYRISRQHDLYQTPFARLHHNSSSFSYESYGKVAKMSVVNRFYLFKKYFAHSKWNWCLFTWSNFGEALINLMQCAKHGNFKPIIGFIEGWSLVFKKKVSYL
jgi:glycosyltransferase involved in cell wall biosynthesis